jgi:hypothetical protein
MSTAQTDPSPRTDVGAAGCDVGAHVRLLGFRTERRRHAVARRNCSASCGGTQRRAVRDDELTARGVDVIHVLVVEQRAGRRPDDLGDRDGRVAAEVVSRRARPPSGATPPRARPARR